jgi:hypothetical protein
MSDCASVLASIENPRFSVRVNGDVRNFASFADALRHALEEAPVAASPRYMRDPHTKRMCSVDGGGVRLSVADADQNGPLVNAYIDLPPCNRAKNQQLVAEGRFTWMLYISRSTCDTHTERGMTAAEFTAAMSAFA